MRVMGVLLAAGGGSRFLASGGPGVAAHKLVADLDGRPLWRHSFDHLVAARLDELVVVTGAAAIDDDIALAADEAQVRVQIVHNPAWADGQAGSLQLAVAAAPQA